MLRHDKGEFNLHFFNNATAEVEDILALPIMREVGARQDTLISCVYYNSKQRFRLLWLHDQSRSGPTLVLGAVQGHSRAVDYDSVHERVDPSRVPDLIHGTHYDFYKKIFKEGLLPGAGNKDSAAPSCCQHRLEQQAAPLEERHRTTHRPGPSHRGAAFTKVRMDITSRVNLLGPRPSRPSRSGKPGKGSTPRKAAPLLCRL